jgi:hypothetical protein
MKYAHPTGGSGLSWWSSKPDPAQSKLFETKPKEAAVSPPKGLLRYDGSLLKTALQKFLRRGMTDHAVAVAQALIAKGEASKVSRRLPVIVAEDCGWQYLWVITRCQESKGEIADTSSTLLKLVHVVSQGVKDKSCEPLMGGARHANKLQGPSDVHKFRDALDSGDLDYASRVIVHELDPRETGVGASPLWGDLLSASRSRPDLFAVVDAVKRRVAAGLFQNDRAMLTIAACQAIVGKSFSDYPLEGWQGQKDWEKVEPEASQIESLADWWWVADAHSWVGRIVSGILCRRYPKIDATWLEWSWFCGESGLVTPARDDRYLKDWSRQIAEKFNGETIEEMTKKWRELLPEVQSTAMWLLKQRGLA